MPLVDLREYPLSVQLAAHESFLRSGSLFRDAPAIVRRALDLPRALDTFEDAWASGLSKLQHTKGSSNAAK